MVSEHMSAIVVMSGPAMIAGSSFNFLAKSAENLQ